MNIGYSSKLKYDLKSYPEKLEESVAGANYRLQEYQNYNENACLATFGPRSKFGASTIKSNQPALSQQLVDIESILSKRNMKLSKERNAEVNNIDVTKFKLKHQQICRSELDSESSRLSHPAFNYKESPQNRFYNLPRNPQANIFYDFSINTSLEEKDNFIPKMPSLVDVKKSLPVEDRKNSLAINCQKCKK